jgi:hypothetical protein
MSVCTYVPGIVAYCTVQYRKRRRRGSSSTALYLIRTMVCFAQTCHMHRAAAVAVAVGGGGGHLDVVWGSNGIDSQCSFVYSCNQAGKMSNAKDSRNAVFSSLKVVL